MGGDGAYYLPIILCNRRKPQPPVSSGGIYAEGGVVLQSVIKVICTRCEYHLMCQAMPVNMTVGLLRDTAHLPGFVRPVLLWRRWPPISVRPNGRGIICGVR
jgi:hypothetical protein